MRAEQIASPRVAWIEPWQPVAEAARRMAINEIGSLAVFDGDRLVALITERDLIRAMADDIDLQTTTVADYMTEEPASVEPGTDAQDAAERMLALGVRHLPVMASGELVGMLSIRDVLGDVAHRRSEP